MGLDVLANVAEITGIVIVIISLIYLNVQTRQNAKMLRSAATQGATNQIARMYEALYSDASMTDVFMRGLDDPQSLSSVESGRFFSWWMQSMFSLQNWDFQTRDGRMGKSALESVCKLLTDLGQTTGFQYFWSNRKFAFDPEFVRFLDDDVLARTPDASFRVFSVR